VWFAGWETQFTPRGLERVVQGVGLRVRRTYGEWMVPGLWYRVARELLKRGARVALPLEPSGPSWWARGWERLRGVTELERRMQLGPDGSGVSEKSPRGKIHPPRTEGSHQMQRDRKQDEGRESCLAAGHAAGNRGNGTHRIYYAHAGKPRRADVAVPAVRCNATTCILRNWPARACTLRPACPKWTSSARRCS